MPKPSYYLHSYGCQMNLADSGILCAAMEKAGYRPAATPDEAGVIIINTCSVREKAEERALGRLAALARFKRDEGSVLCAVGCMAQRMGASLLEKIPEIDFVLGTESLFRLPELLAQKSEEPVVEVELKNDLAWAEYPPVPDNPYAGHVTVTRGCSNFCAYCIVPYLRGPERHRAPETIVADIRLLAERGVVEVTLVGQNVNSYRHENIDFPKLVRLVAEQSGIGRIRFITSHPKDMSDDLISLLAEEPRLMAHVHLPLQSGSDRVLALMARQYTYDHYRGLIDKLRGARPDLSITTDLIVGFPTETEEEYRMTLEAVAEIRYDAAFMFRYSVREGTWAAENLPDDVPEEVKLNRLQNLIDLQKKISYEVNQGEIDRVREVLIDGSSRRDSKVWKGKTEGNKTILVTGNQNLLGQVVSVRVTRADSWTLHGELIS